MISLNKKYALLQKTKCRYVVVTGGRGSGKSFSVQTLLSNRCISEKTGILFTRYTMVSAEKSIIPEFWEKVELLNAIGIAKKTKKEITFSHNDSIISFSGIKTSSGDQTANLKSLKGYNIWVLEEAEELKDEQKFDDIDLSIREENRQNLIIIILNPATKEHWIYKRFFENAGVKEGFTGEKDDVCYIHTTYLDNEKNLSDSFLAQVNRIKIQNPSKYKHTILGGWKDKEDGVIFENWEFGDFEYHTLTGYGLDFGFSIDPTALVLVSIDKKNQRIFVKLHTYKAALSTSQIANECNICENSLIVADSAEPRLINELKKDYGLNIVKCVKGQGSITFGINLMLDYQIIVDHNSIEIAKELNNYVWHDKKSKTPIDDFNHAIDAIRYIVTNLLKKKKKLVIV